MLNDAVDIRVNEDGSVTYVYDQFIVTTIKPSQDVIDLLSRRKDIKTKE